MISSLTSQGYIHMAIAYRSQEIHFPVFSRFLNFCVLQKDLASPILLHCMTCLYIPTLYFPISARFYHAFQTGPLKHVPQAHNTLELKRTTSDHLTFGENDHPIPTKSGKGDHKSHTRQHSKLFLYQNKSEN